MGSYVDQVDRVDQTHEAEPSVDRLLVELVADGEDVNEGPAMVRMKRWLKQGLRTHGLRCIGVTAIVPLPTDSLPQTTSLNHWRPHGRAIRRATTPPTGDQR